MSSADSIDKKWLPEIIRIAREAGVAIMEVYRGEIDVERKDDNSPLTKADLAAHDIIERHLKKLTPHLPILSEESANIPYSERRTWRTYWLVDPLDGTREFIKRNDEFTVNIALIDEDQPVMGVVYAPALDMLYFAGKGFGTFRQAKGEPATRISARPLDPDAVTIAGSRSHAGERMQGFLQRVSEKLSPPQSLSLGSSLKICLVAEGSADLYPRLGLTSEWDTAAAQCVLEQAGGHLLQWNGEALRYNRKDSLLNPEFLACGTTLHDWKQYLE
jgi:3'(2'), 5'-bisphosphate nucleotidase